MKIYTKEEAIGLIGKVAVEAVQEGGIVALETGEDYMDVWEALPNGRFSVISR